MKGLFLKEIGNLTKKICEAIGLKYTHGVVKDKEAIEDSVLYNDFKKIKGEMQRHLTLEEILNKDLRDIQKYNSSEITGKGAISLHKKEQNYSNYQDELQ